MEFDAVYLLRLHSHVPVLLSGMQLQQMRVSEAFYESGTDAGAADQEGEKE